MSTAMVETPSPSHISPPGLFRPHSAATASPRRIDPLTLRIDGEARLPPRRQNSSEGIGPEGGDGESSSSQGDGGQASSTATSPSLSGSGMMVHQKVPVLEDFHLMRVLGTGCAGRVLLVRHSPTARAHAMKAISKRSVLYQGELLHTLEELAILKRMVKEQPRSRFVSRLNYAFTDRENFYFVMRFYPGGDLATQLEIHGRLGAHRMRFYLCDIIQGLEDLHRNGIVVRDLKPENILIDDRGHLVLADFGLSRQFGYRGKPQPLPVPHRAGRRTPPIWAGKGLGSWRRDADGVENIDVDRCNSFVGTPEYLAPEVVKKCEYTYAVDYWAVGCILYEGLVGQVPFRNHDDDPVYLYEKICLHPWYRGLQRHRNDKAWADRYYDFDSGTINLLDGLLAKDPLERLTEPHIKQHEYFIGVDWEMVKHGQYEDPHGLHNQIHPVAEANDRFFPKLHLDEEFRNEKHARAPGEACTPLNDDEAYQSVQDRYKAQLESFAWYEGMEEPEPLEEQKEPADIDADRARLASTSSAVATPSPVDGDQSLGSQVEDQQAGVPDIEATVPLPAPNRHLPDAMSLDSEISSLRIDPGPTPLTPELVRSPRRASIDSHQATIAIDTTGTTTPIAIAPAFHESSLTRPISYTSVLELPHDLPSSGLSVSDVIAVPPSSGTTTARLLRRHNRVGSSGSASINRLSIELDGISQPLGEEEWEELGIEVDRLGAIGEIPSLPNGSRSSSTFLSRFRNKPGEIVSSGLRRQVKSSESSRDNSPTKAVPIPNTIRPFRRNTKKAFEIIKAFPTLKRGSTDHPTHNGPASPASSNPFKHSYDIVSPSLSSTERAQRVPALSTIRSAFGLGNSPATSPSSKRTLITGDPFANTAAAPFIPHSLARRHTEHIPTVMAAITSVDPGGMTPRQVPVSPAMMRSASEQVQALRRSQEEDESGIGATGTATAPVQSAQPHLTEWRH